MERSPAKKKTVPPRGGTVGKSASAPWAGQTTRDHAPAPIPEAGELGAAGLGGGG
jgi:hypothetical protein